MSDIDIEIRKTRSVAAELTLQGTDGAPLAGREVTVAQTRHKFLFGSTGFDLLAAHDDPDAEKRELALARVEKLTGLCNAVTLPFYWARFEPARGEPMTDQLTKAARWFVERGLQVKGHPLCWHTLAPDWLLPLSNAQILEAQLGRIRRDVTGFQGLIDTWDVLNEAVIMPVFDKYDNGLTRVCRELGRIRTVKTVFEAARLANPGAVLLINDFDVSSAYDILVEGLLEAGVQIDVIGIQSHMHQGWWGVEKTQWVLENFERFGLPIHFTETTLVSGRLMPPEIVDLNDYQVTDWPSTPEGEERQAREVVQHYKTLLAHPLVEGLTWWDFADGGWLNAPAGLVRKDASSKPAYDELMRLVKDEWWLAPVTLRTDDDGKVRFSGFPGRYELTCAGKRESFELDRGDAARVEIRL
jgi:endo-1,4-beta-xylanase